MSGRVRIEIRELRVTGATPLEARRLRDALETELARHGAAFNDAPLCNRFVDDARLPTVRACDRVPALAAALAGAIVAKVTS